VAAFREPFREGVQNRMVEGLWIGMGEDNEHLHDDLLAAEKLAESNDQ
jgi:hypothetical protein